MVAFLVSLIITGTMIGIVVLVGAKREPGRPLSWGEAFVAAVFVFTLLFLAYGVVPHQWMAWADNELKWRSDKIGIPVGGIAIGNKHLFAKPYLLFPHGITFGGRGRILVTAQTIRDIVAMAIYGVLVGANFGGWLAFQRRGQRRAEQPAIETSAYGRPLLKKA